MHRDEPGFGYRFIAEELTDAGHDLSERRVWRICSQARIVSARSKQPGRFKKPGPPVHDDLVERDFTAEGPNRLRLTDVTEHPTSEGKLYLCAVKDVWSRRIVGDSIDSRTTSPLAVDALEMAIARRGREEVAGCVVHADRGSQFRSRPYVAALHRHELLGSMGRVASSADNAAMESFFALLQKTVLNTRRWDTRDQLRLAIVTCGSSAPTTGAGGSPRSAGSPPSSLRPQPGRTRGLNTTPEVSTEPSAVPMVVNRVNITTRELAREHRFVSSPTIRVNGHDIQPAAPKAAARRVGRCVGRSWTCRTWDYNGEPFSTPPKH